MVISVGEILDIVIMTAAIGFIFKDIFLQQPKATIGPDNLELAANYKPGFNWEGFKLSVIAIGPAIILHELAHKFVAMAFGFVATFKAHYTFLFLGLILKLINFGFIFLVPGYVQVQGAIPPFEHFLIAFSGPFVHLVLWIGAKFALSSGRKWSETQSKILAIAKQVNMFLFILNMLPIPGIDGWQVYTSLFKLFTEFGGFSI